MYEVRHYRKGAQSENLFQFEVIQGETDLLISCDRDLSSQAEEIVKRARIDLIRYTAKNPVFETSFIPVRPKSGAPLIVLEMIKASSLVNVGPMASVAGAVAEFVGKKLLKYSKQVIVENGGDVFMKSSISRDVLIFAGKSPFSEKIALEIDPKETPVGICTSAGTVGHSFNFGSADAVVIKAASAALADAAATAVGNIVKKAGDIEEALIAAQKIRFLQGVLIIKDDKMGIWGKIKIKRV